MPPLTEADATSHDQGIMETRDAQMAQEETDGQIFSGHERRVSVFRRETQKIASECEQREQVTMNLAEKGARRANPASNS